MNKKEFTEILFEKGIFFTKAEAIKKVDIFFSTLEEILLSEGDIMISNFGKLEVIKKGKRIGRNPKTGEEVKIAERKTIKFKPSKAFLEKLN